MATTPFGTTHDTQSNVITIHELLDRSAQYRMPDYQRRQAWDTDLVVQYLEDVQSIDDDSVNYRGQVMVQPNAPFDNKTIATYDVVDGQQRLIVTTLTIACGCDLLARNGERKRAKQLAQRYLTVSTATGDEPSVSLTRLDNTAYQALLEDPTDDVDHRGLENLTQTVRTWMQDELHSADTVEEFLRRFLHNQTVTHTRIGAQQNGYQAFDDHNTKRENTGPVDRIRSCVMETAERHSAVDKGAVKQAWYRMEAALDAESVKKRRFWRYWVMSNSLYPVKTKITRGTLYEAAAEIINDRIPASGDDMETFMSETADAAELYRMIATETVTVYDADINGQVNYHLRRIDVIGANPARLLVLRALREEIDGSDMIDLLERIEKFTFPRRVTDKRVPDEVRAYIRLAHNAFDSGSTDFDEVDAEFDELMPSMVEFKTEFAQADWSAGKKTLYVLETLEYEYFNPDPGQFGSQSPNSSVEHVAPRKSFTAKKYAPWRKHLSVDEDEFELLKERIGNITLFEDSLNRKAGSDPLGEKQKLYVDSEFVMAQEVSHRSDWSAAVIDRRSRMLADIAARVWDV